MPALKAATNPSGGAFGGRLLTTLAALFIGWTSALPLAAMAADRMVLCLNWAPGADHAALYHARAEGWFAGAELATEIRPGGGSGDALDRLEAGECDAAIADYAAVVAARAEDPVDAADDVFLAATRAGAAFFGSAS